MAAANNSEPFKRAHSSHHWRNIVVAIHHNVRCSSQVKPSAKPSLTVYISLSGCWMNCSLGGRRLYLGMRIALASYVTTIFTAIASLRRRICPSPSGDVQHRAIAHLPVDRPFHSTSKSTVRVCLSTQPLFIKHYSKTVRPSMMSFVTYNCGLESRSKYCSRVPFNLPHIVCWEQLSSCLVFRSNTYGCKFDCHRQQYATQLPWCNY